MRNKIRVGDNINDVNPQFYTLVMQLQQVGTRLARNASWLESDAWSGEMKAACKEAHEAVEIYQRMLLDMCNTMVEENGKLLSGVNGFRYDAQSVKRL